MPEGSRDRGTWILRAAIVLLIVSSTVRYFGDSSASDTAATWILSLSTAVGLIGIALIVIEKRRKAVPATEDEDPGAT